MDNLSAPITAQSFLDVVSLPKPQEDQMDRDSTDMTYMSETAGWKLLRKYIEGQLSLMDSVNVSDTDSVEQVGFKYLATKLAKIQLEALITYVEGSRADD